METATTNTSSRKDMWLSKAAWLLETQGAAAVREFAIGLAQLEMPEAIAPILQLLNDAGHISDNLLGYAGLCRAWPDRLDVAETFGKRVRAAASVVGAPLTGRPCPPASQSTFVTVLGTSHVRSLARGTRFLPLMLGNGNFLSFLTADLATASRQRISLHLDRADPASLVLMFLGSDAVTHVKDYYGTQAAVARGDLPPDDELMRLAARRYFAFIDDIRAAGKCNPVLFCVPPMVRPEINRLIEIYNALLRDYAAQNGVPLLDLTEQLRDPETGCLRPDLRASEGDDHISHMLVQFMENDLDRLGLLPDAGDAFEWNYMFRFPLGKDADVKIWSEPYNGAGNVLVSQKIMFTQLAERALNILVGACGANPGSTVAILNGREGYFATGLPVGFAARTVSVDVDRAASLMGQRIAAYVGRSNLCFETADSISHGADLIAETDIVFMTIHEKDALEECIAVLKAVAPKIKQRIFVFTALDLEERLRETLEASSVTSFRLANRLTTGYWNGGRLIAITP